MFYLEQSFPGPPPCTPTSLHGFLVNSVELKEKQGKETKIIAEKYCVLAVKAKSMTIHKIILFSPKVLLTNSIATLPLLLFN